MKQLFLLLCCILFLVRIANGQELTKELDALVNKITTEADPGISVGIIKDGRVVFRGQKGLANLEYIVPLQENTVFPIASITKQLTSSCIGILVKKGLIDVNDPVHKYLPELPMYESEIRIRHLMNHTSGIRNYNVLLDLKGFDYVHSGYTNEDIETLIFDQKGVNTLPGEKMLYSNSNYVLLALVIERVSGKSISTFAQEELFEPLGMHQTRFRTSIFEIAKNPAYGYFQSEGKWAQQKSVTLCVGAGGVISSVGDLLQWSTIFTDGQHDFSWLARFLIHQDTLLNGSLMNYGRGVFLDTYNGHATIHHSGRDLGSRSQLLIAPEENFAAVILSNSNSINAVGFSYEIFDLFYPYKESTQNEKGAYKPDNIDLRAITGTYQELNSDMRMDIFVSGDTVMAKSSFGREPVPLLALSKGVFQRMDNSSVRHNFFALGVADCDMIVDFGGASFYFERIQMDTLVVNLKDFSGNYYSNELDVTYSFTVNDNQLVLTYPNNSDVNLTYGQKDEFGTKRRTKFSFFRDDNNGVKGFYAGSEGTVKDILFKKAS